MRRHFAIILLFGALTMNMDIVCQSLCLSGHGDMADAHASHKTTNHEMPKGDMCPIAHNYAKASHHDMPQSSIKCDCSVDQAASLGFEFTSADSAFDATPYLRIVSRIQPQGIIFLSKEAIPSEGPPKLIS